MIAGLPGGGFDELKRGARLPRGVRACLSGWALDETAPLRAVLLTMNDVIIATALPGVARDDLAAAYPTVRHAADCGWRAVLDLRGFAPGPGTVGLTALTAAGTAVPLAAVEVELTGETLGARRERCVFTIAQNEKLFLPLWLGYYSHHFEPADIFVLDHDSTDGSTAGLAGRCNVVQVHHSTSFDHNWLKTTVEHFQSFLLGSYEAVLFAEADEFVMAHPERYAGLADYIRRMPGPVARCQGFDVVQDAAEPALRCDEPLLRQRAWWHPSPDYSKTLLAKTPLIWTRGFHDLQSRPAPPPDPDLVLAHLHRVDYASCAARHEAAARRAWSAEDVAQGLGRQNMIFEPAAFRRWFYEEADSRNAPRVQIPDMFRKAFP